MIYKTLHRKIKIEQHEHNKKRGGGLVCSGSVSSFCSTSGTCRVNFVKIVMLLIITSIPIRFAALNFENNVQE